MHRIRKDKAMTRPSSEPDAVRIARENVEAYTTGDWSRLKAVVTQDVVYNELGSQRRLQGADQMVQTYQGWKKAFPDGKGTITRALASGDFVTIEVTWTGTHTGPLIAPNGTIPPTGKSMSLPGAQVITMQNGKIKELHQYFDLLTLLQQLGVAPK